MKEDVYKRLERFLEANWPNICDIDLDYNQFERPEEWALQTFDRFHQHRLTFTEANKIIDFIYKNILKDATEVDIGEIVSEESENEVKLYKYS
uniref:Uncharacterized protein n=1 Tax=Meloidogyne hapla TaxID=6305 RepID=A0A1I8BRU9_MELHA